MPPTSSRSRRPDDAGGQDTETSPLEDMRQADIANGENPDEETGPPPPEASPEGGSHPTGERQASDNRENDPPA